MGGAGLIDRHTTIVEEIERLFFSTLTVTQDVYTRKNRYLSPSWSKSPARVMSRVDRNSKCNLNYTHWHLGSSEQIYVLG
jgi:hypothetical protein